MPGLGVAYDGSAWVTAASSVALGASSSDIVLITRLVGDVDMHLCSGRQCWVCCGSGYSCWIKTV